MGDDELYKLMLRAELGLDKEESVPERKSVKIPIKHLEIQIRNFNEIALPHRLDILKQHQVNIKQYSHNREWDRVYSEQVNACRSIKQLQQLLFDLDALRSQVFHREMPTFDQLTKNSRASVLKAIKEYLEFKITFPLIENPPNILKKTPSAENLLPDERFVKFHADQEEMERQQTCLDAFKSVQGQLENLQSLYVDFALLVREQAKYVDEAGNDVYITEDNVNVGLRHLQNASKYNVMTYPLAGALLGTFLGGPIGFMAGLKLGSLAAIGGGLLGFAGGRILKQKYESTANLRQLEPPSDESDDSEDSS